FCRWLVLEVCGDDCGAAFVIAVAENVRHLILHPGRQALRTEIIKDQYSRIINNLGKIECFVTANQLPDLWQFPCEVAEKTGNRLQFNQAMDDADGKVRFAQPRRSLEHEPFRC